MAFSAFWDGRSLPAAGSRQAQIPAPKPEFNEQLPCTAVWSPYPPDPVLAGVACSHKAAGAPAWLHPWGLPPPKTALPLHLVFLKNGQKLTKGGFLQLWQL